MRTARAPDQGRADLRPGSFDSCGAWLGSHSLQARVGARRPPTPPSEVAHARPPDHRGLPGSRRAGLRRPDRGRGRAGAAGRGARPPDLPRDGPPGAGDGRRAGRAGHRARGAGRGASPERRPAAGDVLRGDGVRAGCSSRSTSGSAPEEVALHRRALRRVGAARRPGVDEALARRDREAPLRPRHGVGRGAAALGRRAASRGRRPTRTRPPRSTTPAARPPGPKGVQITHRNIWINARHLRAARRGHRPRRLPAHAADVPLQRLGHAVRAGRAGRAAGGAAQDRRRGDPAPGRATRA